MKVLFLRLDEVLFLHAEQIDRYGGIQGVRDLGLLESAIASPEASFDGKYFHGTVAEKAAAYLFHIAQNHPFLDGNKRAAELKDRGFQNAGLYNPEGVGGTHVMYVLKHADKPELEGLPLNASISPVVSLWKGGLKPLALLGMGAAVLGGLLHYLKVGPNDADAEAKEREAS